MTEHLLIKELQKLRESSKQAVADGNSYSLDAFKEYLHIEREVEATLKEIIINSSQSTDPALILVCGNVGDGKSHILSKLNLDLKAEVAGFTIHNDATESHDPFETSNETLRRVLDGFCDDRISSSKDKCILAINLGTLSKFLEEYGPEFSNLRLYVEQQNILENKVTKDNNETSFSVFRHVNFTDFHMYSLEEKGPSSKIISELLSKLTADVPENIVYRAFSQLNDNLRCPVKTNFEFLCIKQNQEIIESLIIQAIVKNKTIVSVRSLLNFIHDLLVPIGLPWNDMPAYIKYINELSSDEFVDMLVPNYLFEHPELSPLFESITSVDPSIIRSSINDHLVIELISSENPLSIWKNNTARVNSLPLIQEVPHLGKGSLTKLFIRMKYFSHALSELSTIDPIFNEYVKELFHYNSGSKNGYRRVYSLVKESIRKWYGDPKINDKVVLMIGRNQSKYRIFSDFDISPIPITNNELSLPKISKFQDELSVSFLSADGEATITVHVDFRLFELLKRIQLGYRPNRKDNNNYYSFVGIINKVIAQSSSKGTMYIDEVNMGDKSDFKLSIGDFGEFNFSRA